jgi:hypothetical protein
VPLEASEVTPEAEPIRGLLRGPSTLISVLLQVCRGSKAPDWPETNARNVKIPPDATSSSTAATQAIEPLPLRAAAAAFLPSGVPAHLCELRSRG